MGIEGDNKDVFLKVAIEAARASGEIIRSAFHKTKTISEKKNISDLVTESDTRCEAIISSIIKQNFPNHKFIGEEMMSDLDDISNILTNEPTWMCDPIDGTTNFIHKFPFTCTSIALVINKQVIIGVVYNPILEELYTAKKGNGAYCNDNPIKVSETDQLSKTLFGCENGISKDEEVVSVSLERFKRLTKATRAARMCGSCALNLCSVASGRLDFFYEIGFGGCWDVAAASLILNEAGGYVLDPCGSAFQLMSRRVLGSNGERIGNAVAKIIADCPKTLLEPQPLPY